MSKEKVKKEYKQNKEVINIKEFMLLKSKEQDKLILDTLNKIYEDNYKVSNKEVEKVLNVVFNDKDNDTYLPESLCVIKEGNKLIFKFKEKNRMLLILFLLAFLFIGGFATYMGAKYIRSSKLNIDLDDDGRPELNIDLDGDGICDINCDINNDRKPDRNIDYMKNNKAIFNVVKKDGSIFNKVNQDTNNDGKCDLNCDIDDDGWPDINIDLDGDGKADLNIDTDGDKKADLNIDTNGDGVPDINIDTNDDGKCDKNCISNLVNVDKELDIDLDGDGICDVNCDTNGDKKPDEKIDYGGNKKPTFNVPDENGNLKNKVNQDKNGDGICDLNCDLDDDGWPDINIDLDSDGTPDLNIDTNGDGTPDLNIDTDKDGKPDFNIDDDGDSKCDRNCTFVVDPSGKGGQATVGDNNVNIDAAALVVAFENGNNVTVSDLYPDDQTDDDVNTKVPDIKFSVSNNTDKILYYNIDWINVENNFESNNFWFKVVSNYSGFNADWSVAPFTSGRLASKVAIAPNTKQNYTVSFTLHGTGEEQNYDQGKTFKGKISLELLED